MDLAALFTPENIAALLTLSLMEIVLGIDNLVFVAILTERLPKEKQKLARQVGLAGALIMRIILLLSVSWLVTLTQPLFTIEAFKIEGEPVVITWQTLIMVSGGLFLIWKAVSEIYHKVELHDEGVRHADEAPKAKYSFGSVIANIMLMDIVFSLDSVLTAVAMANDITVMIVAVVLAMIVMIAFADPIANFINSYASLKILALAFLLMIGTLLVAEAFHVEVPKGFVYFAMFFSLGVELVQIRYEANLKKRRAQAEAA